MKVDIFGNGSHICEADELSGQITNDDGLYVQDNCSVGLSYSLKEPSEDYKIKLNAIKEKEQEMENKRIENQVTLKSLSDRILELENKIK